MTSDLDLRGVWVPLITPFDAAGAVDVAGIERLVGDALKAGVSGIGRMRTGIVGSVSGPRARREGLQKRKGRARRPFGCSSERCR